MLTLHRFHLNSNLLIRAAAKLRPTWMMSFSLAERDLSEGLRAATSATVMLIVGELLRDPLFAWAAIGAFWTCLADAGGTPARRFASMTSLAVLSTLAGGVTAFASSFGTLSAAVAIFVFAVIAGLAGICSVPAYQVAVLVATASVVMVDHPLESAHDAVPFLATYAIGCAFAILLSFTIWRNNSRAPARAATRLAYIRLAELARDTANLMLSAEGPAHADWARNAAELRAQTRSALETAKTAVARVSRSANDGQSVYSVLSAALADAERVFGGDPLR